MTSGGNNFNYFPDNQLTKLVQFIHKFVWNRNSSDPSIRGPSGLCLPCLPYCNTAAVYFMYRILCLLPFGVKKDGDNEANSAADDVNERRLIFRTIDELLGCMRSSVTDSCGDVAGHWLFTFKSLIMLPVQHHLGCSSSLTGRCSLTFTRRQLSCNVVTLAVRSVNGSLTEMNE